MGRSSTGERDETERDRAARRLPAARNGDREAFVVIVDLYDERLRALAFHMVRDSEATRDVLQDAYVKAYLGLPGFREDADLGTWFYRIVYTTCLNYLRGVSRRPRATGDDPSSTLERMPVPGDDLDEVDANLDLSALLLTLPVEQRAAVVLVDAWGLSFARTAEILGVPQGTIASRVAAARDKLRPALRPGQDVPQQDVPRQGGSAEPAPAGEKEES